MTTIEQRLEAYLANLMLAGEDPWLGEITVFNMHRGGIDGAWIYSCEDNHESIFLSEN